LSNRLSKMKFKNIDNASATVLNFSEIFGYKAHQDLVDEIQKHPFYPSLLSISEVIDNEAGIKQQKKNTAAV
jgi:hypothetical protein